MKPSSIFALAGALVATVHAAQTLHYWDMDTVDGGGVPIDVIGGLATTAGLNLNLAHTAYGPAGGSGGNYLRTVRGVDGVPHGGRPQRLDSDRHGLQRELLFQLLVLRGLQ